MGLELLFKVTYLLQPADGEPIRSVISERLMERWLLGMTSPASVSRLMCNLMAKVHGQSFQVAGLPRQCERGIDCPAK